jgi:uncharacterized membrane protein (UPF0127 family)
MPLSHALTFALIPGKNLMTDVVRLRHIVGHVKRCNAFETAWGLMFSRPEDRALVFRFRRARRVTLHSFFVFYPFDVVFLSHHGDVLEIKRDLLPFRLYRSGCRAVYVVELPRGCAPGLAEGTRLLLE